MFTLRRLQWKRTHDRHRKRANDSEQRGDVDNIVVTNLMIPSLSLTSARYISQRVCMFANVFCASATCVHIAHVSCSKTALDKGWM
jgi:hypothetical protein